MTLQYNEISIKNFMSIGNITQKISLSDGNLVLIVGKNLDKNVEGATNGCGKSTIINALSFALYGEPISDIKKANVVNKINKKAMYISLDFTKDGTDYRIERGIKPNVFHFFVDGNLFNDEEAEIKEETRAASRDTQAEIVKVVGMSHDLFKKIMVLDTGNDPFLKQKDKDRKPIIEELLGITILSAKSEQLKIQLKEMKNLIREEETAINLHISNNERIEANINNLELRKASWKSSHEARIKEIEDAISDMSLINIEEEIENHKKTEEMNGLFSRINQLQNALLSTYKTRDMDEKLIETKSKFIDTVIENKCPECGQDVHDDIQKRLIDEAKVEIEEIKSKMTEDEETIKILEDEIILVSDQVNDMGTEPDLYYRSVHDAYSHANKIGNLKENLKSEIDKENPFEAQIENMKTTSIVDISYDKINEYTRIEDHMTFLNKLLTSSDSFIRKNIIDQNLSFLNKRMSYYAEKLMLLHFVKFNNDLSATITKNGNEYDYQQLSAGERTRVTLALSWAFRDTWESLNFSTNLWIFDEIVDSGMDQQGIEDSIKILNQFVDERKKDVFLISHKLDLASNIENVLYAVMEEEFTEYTKSI